MQPGPGLRGHIWMMNIARLKNLHGIARLRKIALMLSQIEHEIACSEAQPEISNLLHQAGLIADFLEASGESAPELLLAARQFKASAGNAQTPNFDLCFRALNNFRHTAMRGAGQAPADWDFWDYRGTSAEQVRDERFFYPGLKVYLEDIRSPFNVGTIFRTAEAFGFEEVILSPGCADPRHPRALRSSMGTIDMIPWRRASLDEASPGASGIFALELGGTPLGSFTFPRSGLLILGSEELGVSQNALSLARAHAGILSIPMKGIKASINVAVAFGIAASAWASSQTADFNFEKSSLTEAENQSKLNLIT